MCVVPLLFLNIFLWELLYHEPKILELPSHSGGTFSLTFDTTKKTEDTLAFCLNNFKNKINKTYCNT